jgi:hypothetical protein
MKKVLYLLLFLFCLISVNAENEVKITNLKEFDVFQRNLSNQSEITIKGQVKGNISELQVKFSSQNWQNFSINKTNFTKSFNFNVGQGSIILRNLNNFSQNYSVNNITIGDIYVIAGQSNHEGRALEPQYLNESNNFKTFVYKEDDSWSLANDKMDTGSGPGSPFPILANYLDQQFKIPVIYITTATGGTSIKVWQKGDNTPYGYDNMFNQIKEATNNQNKVKAVLFYQGETDSYKSSFLGYENYKLSLNNMVNSMKNDFESEFIFIGQIGSVAAASSFTLDSIRQAQIESWDNSNISAGVTTYDIGVLVDNLHFRRNHEVEIFAKRWFSVINDTYTGGDGRGPKIESVYINSSNLKQVFINISSNPKYNLIISNYNGTKLNQNLKGFRFIKGDTLIKDDNILNTSFNNQTNTIELILDTQITTDYSLTFGSHHDSVNKNVLRYDNLGFIPLETIYNKEIYYLGNATINITQPPSVEPPKKSSSSSGGGSSKSRKSKVIEKEKKVIISNEDKEIIYYLMLLSFLRN